MGKTTLVSYITGEPYQALSQYKTGQFITVNLEAPYNVQLKVILTFSKTLFIILNNNLYKLWDIPNYCTGVKNLGTIFALRVHVCIGLFDCANDLSFYNLPNWIEKFKSSYFLEGDEYQPTTFIVATKLAKKRPNSDFTKMAVWASDHDYAYEEIDTVNQTNTDLLLETIVRAAINGGLDKVSRKSARAV